MGPDGASARILGFGAWGVGTACSARGSKAFLLLRIEVLNDEACCMLAEVVAHVRQSEVDFAVAGGGDHFGVEKPAAVVAHIRICFIEASLDIRYFGGAIILGHVNQEASVDVREVR